MYVTSLQLGNRCSNLAQYCPDLTNIYIPPPNKSYYSADGIPWAIAIGFTNWKGRALARTGPLFVYLNFNLNPSKQNSCLFSR